MEESVGHLNWSDPQFVLIVQTAAIIVYTILTGLIWYANLRTLATTRQLLEATTRPHIGVSEVTIDWTVHGGPVDLLLTIENSGPSSGRRIEVEIYLNVGGMRVPISSDTRGPYRTLLPGKLFTVSGVIPTEQSPDFHPDDFKVQISLRYQSAAEKQYTHSSTYGYSYGKQRLVLLGADSD